MTIQVTDREVIAALARLQERLGNFDPLLRAIGEDLVARTKQRFATATAPDGTAWRANSPATIQNYIRSRGGFSKKTGKLLAKGEKLQASKKPLQGTSGDLARQIHYQVANGELTMGSSMIYAAMQHFGGKKSRFAHLWGDIPAREFLPITAAGELYPSEATAIVGMLREYLEG